MSYYVACPVDGIRFLTYNRDSRGMTQNSGDFVPGTYDNTFYGQLEDILEFTYLNGFLVILLKCKWFNTDPTKKKNQN